MYVKATQTDAVALEPHRPEDEDEDDAVVEVVSSQPVATHPETHKVGCLHDNHLSLSIYLCLKGQRSAPSFGSGDVR